MLMPEKCSRFAERFQKMTVRSLTTIAILISLMGAPALARAFDARAPEAATTPTATGAEKPAEKPATASDVLEVPASEGETEPDQGAAGEENASEVGGEIYTAIRAGKWLAAVGFALLLLVALARKFGGKWAKTRAGGYVLGFGVPMLGALGLSLTTGQWSIDLYFGAFSAGLVASGLHTTAKDAKGEKGVRVRD
jgi:hypothetical protein